MNDLRKTFERFDQDESGFIEVSELDQLLNELGLDSSGDLVLVALARLETADASRVTFDELEAWWNGPAANLQTPSAFAPEVETKLRGLFDRFDADGSGTIDIVELTELLAAAGLSFTDETVYAAIQSADRNNDGQMDWGEFLGWWSVLHGS